MLQYPKASGVYEIPFPVILFTPQRMPVNVIRSIGVMLVIVRLAYYLLGW